MKSINKNNSNLYKYVRTVAGDNVVRHRTIHNAMHYSDIDESVTKILFTRNGKQGAYVRTGPSTWREESL